MDATQTLSIAFKSLPHGEGLPLPVSGTSLSAGLDLSAALEEDVTLAPGQRSLIPCGFCMALPAGYEGQIRPRSGLSYKHGITVLNSPGTVDADYRGEIKVLLINHGQENFTLTRGMRIAQLVIAPFMAVEWHLVSELSPSESGDSRGVKGFGSTGLHAEINKAAS